MQARLQLMQYYTVNGDSGLAGACAQKLVSGMERVRAPTLVPYNPVRLFCPTSKQNPIESRIFLPKST